MPNVLSAKVERITGTNVYLVQLIIIEWGPLRKYRGPNCLMMWIRLDSSPSATDAAEDTVNMEYMPFSGTNRTKILRPIVLKICIVNYVGKSTKPAKNGCNRLARGGSPNRWNTSICTLPYPTLIYFTFFRYWSYRPDNWTDLHARCVKRRGLTQGRAFWGLIDKNFFTEGISLLQKFQRAFYTEIKAVE
jgi:hypothetical protein